MENYLATGSLNALSNYLYRYYGKKVIILLDEYDTPMQEAWVHGYWQEMITFARSLFNATFKTNPSLERAIMTGITRVSKESVFSDLNNLNIVSTPSAQYSDCFGFTEAEVFAALEEYGLADRKADVKKWYDGFTFGNQKDIYNPWSILNYMKTGNLSAYWANTSSNSLVGKLVQKGSERIKTTMEGLLKGHSFTSQIDEQIVFSQLENDEDAIWSLLLASGYLRAEEHWFDTESGNEQYRLCLTNREVLSMFQRIIRGWFVLQRFRKGASERKPAGDESLYEPGRNGYHQLFRQREQAFRRDRAGALLPWLRPRTPGRASWKLYYHFQS